MSVLISSLCISLLPPRSYQHRTCSVPLLLDLSTRGIGLSTQNAVDNVVMAVQQHEYHCNESCMWWNTAKYAHVSVPDSHRRRLFFFLPRAKKELDPYSLLLLSTAFSLPLPSFPPLLSLPNPSPSFPTPPLISRPLNTARGSGELCKLPQ